MPVVLLVAHAWLSRAGCLCLCLLLCGALWWLQFDYLKSLEIEEKINKIRWCHVSHGSSFLLSTNDKTIKLWKVSLPFRTGWRRNLAMLPACSSGCSSLPCLLVFGDPAASGWTPTEEIRMADEEKRMAHEENRMADEKNRMAEGMASSCISW